MNIHINWIVNDQAPYYNKASLKYKEKGKLKASS